MAEKRIFVTDLAAGMTIDQVFTVQQKDLRRTKKGDLYISADLADRTGSITARMWQANEAVYNHIPSDGLLHVKGRVEDYRGTHQLIIDACRPVPPDQVDISDFLPTTPHDVEEMFGELLEILRSIKDTHVKMLIKRFLDDKDIVAGFKKAPAAVQMHHAYMGGLCEHTLGVARSARALLPLYPRLNEDLVLAGVFLHDVAKLAELHCGVGIHYTDRGQLVGHIVMACMWIEEKAKEVEEELGEAFPQRILDVLEHIVLSHHGVYEFGSPKLPAVPEAFFIHFLDNLDAKMWMTSQAIDGDTDHDSSWTGYMHNLETRLYKRSGDITESDGNLFSGIE
jgi:3'-5' exoribonuclease